MLLRTYCHRHPCVLLVTNQGMKTKELNCCIAAEVLISRMLCAQPWYACGLKACGIRAGYQSSGRFVVSRHAVCAFLLLC